jgi:hypothetical protein
LTIEHHLGSSWATSCRWPALLEATADVRVGRHEQALGQVDLDPVR